MPTLRFNWTIWAGFLVSVLAFLSFFLFFYRFPATRDFPWANLILFGAGAALLAVGIRRAYVSSDSYRGKVSGPILAALSAVVFVMFVLIVFVAARQLPAAKGAPQAGQKAPDFTLLDTHGKSESLAELLSAPIAGPSGVQLTTRGVLLVFYRGYW